MGYTIKQFASIAGVSVRTLHYYDQIGLLKPEFRGANGYRQYGDESILVLQQIMFFRELDFSLEEIKRVITQPDFNRTQALESQRILLRKKAARIRKLLLTIDKTIRQLKGETKMNIEEYYQGFSDDQIKQYREEVKQRWGEKALENSESRVISMGKEKFAALQADADKIYQAIADNIPNGYDSSEVQILVAAWRQWLENFHHYSDEAVLGLGKAYSEDARFAKFYRRYHRDMPEFFTKAIEYYLNNAKLSNPT